MSDSRVTVVLTTAANETEGATISRALVEEHLAACVQRLPIASTYRWRDRVEESSECLLIIKTLATLVDEVGRRIHALSSYDVPEVVALEAASVASAYGAWLASACRDIDQR